MLELYWFQYDYLGEAQRKAIVCVSGCGENKEAVVEIKQIGKEKVW